MFCGICVLESYGYVRMWLLAQAYHSTCVEIREQISTVGPYLSTLLRQGLLCCINHDLAGGMERCLSEIERLPLLQRT